MPRATPRHRSDTPWWTTTWSSSLRAGLLELHSPQEHRLPRQFGSYLGILAAHLPVRVHQDCTILARDVCDVDTRRGVQDVPRNLHRLAPKIRHSFACLSWLLSVLLRATLLKLDSAEINFGVCRVSAWLRGLEADLPIAVEYLIPAAAEGVMRRESIEASGLRGILGALQPLADKVGKLRRLRLLGGRWRRSLGGGWRRWHRGFTPRRDALGTAVPARGEREKSQGAEECCDGMAAHVVMVPIAPISGCRQGRVCRNCYRMLRTAHGREALNKSAGVDFETRKRSWPKVGRWWRGASCRVWRAAARIRARSAAAEVRVRPPAGPSTRWFWPTPEERPTQGVPHPCCDRSCVPCCSAPVPPPS